MYGETCLAKDPLASWDTIHVMVWSTLLNPIHGRFIAIRGLLAIRSLLDIGRVIGHRNTTGLLSCLGGGEREGEARTTQRESRSHQLKII
jgi:hypothetical protein